MHALLFCSGCAVLHQLQHAVVLLVLTSCLACRIVEALAMMLMQAVELRARCLEHLAGLLTPRQMAYVLIAPCDMLQLA